MSQLLEVELKIEGSLNLLVCERERALSKVFSSKIK